MTLTFENGPVVQWSGATSFAILETGKFDPNEKQMIIDTITAFYNMFHANNNSDVPNTSEQAEPIVDVAEPTFKEKLLAATAVNAESESESSMHYISSGIEHLIKKEFYFFYTNNIKGKFLTQVEKWLDTIRPTSVEAECCFSAAGLLASKVRNRLGDEVLSVLQILRFYFAKHANKQDAP